MYRLNFKIRILIYIAIAAIIPFTISWYFMYNMVEDKLQQDLFNMRNADIQNQVSKIEQMFRQNENILSSIAKSYSYLPSDEASIKSFLNQQLHIKHNFINLYILKNDNLILSRNNYTSSNSLDLEAFIKFINSNKSNEPTWLGSFFDNSSNKRSIGITTPLQDLKGNDNGVLLGSIPLEILDNLIKSDLYKQDMEIILLDSLGNVQYDFNNEYNQNVNINDNNFILYPLNKKLLNVSHGKETIKFKEKNWTCIFSTINSNDWKVVILVDADKFISEVDFVNKNIYSLIILFGILAILLVWIFAVILSNSISKPLLKLRDGASALAMGKLDYKIKIEGNDEINDVASSINEMSTNLNRTYEELFSRTEELNANNNHLQEINIELEASYQQLGAAMVQLNESEEKYRKLMNNISDMVFVINDENIIVYANSKMEQVLGYNESGLIGIQISVIIKEEIEAQTSHFIKAWENDFIEYQLEMTKYDGSVITVEGSAQRIIEEGKVIGVQAIARDITQRKLMESQLEKRYHELQLLNRVSNAIANTLDLNNLLNTIVTQVIDVSDALVCSIRLIDSTKENKLVLKAIDGIKIQSTQIEDLEISNELMEKIIDNKQSISMELIKNQLHNKYMKKLYTREQVKYITFNPLIIQGTTIGVMSATTRTMPSVDQLELMTSLANSIAIAIDNARAYENLKHAYIKTVQSLVSAVEAKDLYTESHSIRVAKYACFIASEMGYSKTFIEDVWVAGVLHDIGKIGISDWILNKKDKLTNEEYQLIKNHPNISYKILSKIGLRDDIMDAVKHHHERYDGKGYPDGLDGANTSVIAAIISVADAFDAITSERSYKKARSISQGVNEIVINSGTQFDPKVVDVFERVFLMKLDTIEKIYNNDEIDFFNLQ